MYEGEVTGGYVTWKYKSGGWNQNPALRPQVTGSETERRGGRPHAEDRGPARPGV